MSFLFESLQLINSNVSLHNYCFIPQSVVLILLIIFVVLFQLEPTSDTALAPFNIGVRIVLSLTLVATTTNGHFVNALLSSAVFKG